MRHEEQIVQIKKLLTHLDQGTNVDAGGLRKNPSSAYTDAPLADREWASFFRDHPQIIGLSADLAEPGSFLTLEDFGTPILATRDESGRFRAFVNSCRHRGTIVEQRVRGTSEHFTCPFHGWTYAADGALVGLPKPKHFGAIDKSCHGLLELPAKEVHGLLWVHPDPAATIDVDALLGPKLSDELAHWNFDQMKYLDGDSYDVACNWKLAMDTFGETYHFPVLHKNTILLGFHGNVQCYDTFGRNHRMLLCRRGIDEMRHLPEKEWKITVAALPAYWLFPNVQLLPFEDGCYLVRAYPVPGEPGRHISRISFYLRPDVAQPIDEQRSPDAQLSLAQMFARVIRDEDYAMSASQQRSANSGALSEVLFGRNEPALHHYHSTYREALGMEPLPLLESNETTRDVA